MSVLGVNGALAGPYQYANRTQKQAQGELSAMGHEIHSSGIVIHPDGTVTHYISGDLKPEVRAKIEAKMKAEDEEKAKRKRRYQELSREAAEKRKQAAETSVSEGTRQNANVQDIYEALKSTNPLMEQEDSDVSDEGLEQVDKQESESKTDIIVKPDGSRVLVMTMSIGGMETTMSLEISKPTEAPNENSKHDTDNNMISNDAEMDAVSDEMSNI